MIRVQDRERLWVIEKKKRDLRGFRFVLWVKGLDRRRIRYME